ncbi:hypothetical protein IFM89_013510 [Coptis chinensis]|uniref:GOLD domain-containing protein n=1 Tax=Coptis chinensis TaxID=261450 RepID=A0A835LHV1_9MAGN|nr:hypothetical protein IFM89_013510 [Coptis chinensis]
MASTEGLVPITRAFLSNYYDNYPFTPLSSDVSQLSSQLISLSKDLISQIPPTPDESVLAHEADCEPPHKIDENMWKNREHIEETLFLLDKPNWPQSLQQHSTPEDIEIATILGDLKSKLQTTMRVLEVFHTKNSDNVFNTVMTYMPQDFRGTLIRQQRDRSERNKQAEVDAVVNSGGGIRERYALLWKQQMERRRQLAQLGSATGVYKTLVKYLVGVPQVLLDFIRQINDDHGPMEEQRERYGPSLYSLTKMAIAIRLFLVLAWGRFEAKKLEKSKVDILVHAVDVYTSEMERFLKFIGEVFANSPFFISARDVGGVDVRETDYKETTIPAGKTFEDVGFSMEYTSPSGEVNMILPYRRYDSNQGNFCTVIAGNYKLIWDNSYSSFFKKNLRYKVDCIPPVAEPVQLNEEEE